MKSLLLVEDNESIGSLTSKTMEAELGMPVTWVTTLADTVRILEDSDPENFFAAILDFVLPDAPHGQIIDLVVKQGIPSIVFTASLSDDIREYVWARKVVDYILKDDSSSLDYLVSALKKLISNTQTKILIVDDASFFRKVISELLYIHRYKIIAATSGEEALRALDMHHDIKLVITDYIMPGMDGCELCKKIRDTHKKEDLAIIGISTEGNAAMAARFIKSGANDFIVKQSFILEEFYCRISQCIETIDLIHLTKEAAIKDFLTGLHNRRYFFDQGQNLFDASLEKRIPLACAMLDIDHFKQINDTHGHDVGDQVLIQLSQVLQKFCSQKEIVARLGGEEFCILSLLDPKDQGNKQTNAPATVAMERFGALCQRIAAMEIDIKASGPLKITVSIGVGFNESLEFDGMLKQADERLYLAKTSGRNQVVLSLD